MSGVLFSRYSEGRMTGYVRIIIAVLVVMLLALQFRLWVGEGSLAEVNNLQHQISNQQAALVDLEEENAALRAEVDDLRQGFEAIESRARSELGLIREGETYFQLVEPEANDN